MKDKVRRASVLGDLANGRDGLVSEILDALPVALFCKDAGNEFRFICWNRAAEAWWGLPRERMLGRNDYDFFPRAQADFFRAKDEETMRSGERVEIPEEPLDTPMGLRLLHRDQFRQTTRPHPAAIPPDTAHNTSPASPRRRPLPAG